MDFSEMPLIHIIQNIHLLEVQVELVQQLQAEWCQWVWGVIRGAA